MEMYQKITVSILLLFLLIVCVCLVFPTPAEAEALPAPIPDVSPYQGTFLPVSAQAVTSDLNLSAEAAVLIDSVAKEAEERPGMIGRLYIPAVNIDVAVFSSKAQETCDADDSGCMFKQNNMILIVDHYYQEFKPLGECYVGCLAYIVTPENITPYICSATFTGTNMRDDIFDENWESVTIHYPGSIICYTCMDEYLHIRMVNFEFFPSKVFQ